MKMTIPEIHIPKNLTTMEYHQLLAHYRFKFEVNPSKVEYKHACDDIKELLDN